MPTALAAPEPEPEYRRTFILEPWSIHYGVGQDRLSRLAAEDIATRGAAWTAPWTITGGAGVPEDGGTAG